MRRYFNLPLIGLALLSILIASCGGDEDKICTPGEYICGGSEGNLLQYCSSAGSRYETLTDCEETGRVCFEGNCIDPDDLDGDTDLTEDGDSESIEAEDVE